MRGQEGKQSCYFGLNLKGENTAAQTCTARVFNFSNSRVIQAEKYVSFVPGHFTQGIDNRELPQITFLVQLLNHQKQFVTQPPTEQ